MKPTPLPLPLQLAKSPCAPGRLDANRPSAWTALLATFLVLALPGHPAIAAVNDGVGVWQVGSSVGAPTPRADTHAVWTGHEMIVWGGYNGYSDVSTGGRYDPVSNRWVALPTAGAPAARRFATAVWTGSEMIIWGGFDELFGDFNDGARYNPVANTWRPISTNGAPSPRRSHTAVWTGTEMIIWGGYGGSYMNTGGRYNPATDTWMPVNENGSPSGRALPAAVWTGTEMIIWGGMGDGYVMRNTGGRYNPSSDRWAPTSLTNVPAGRFGPAFVWTGREMIVWGGRAAYPGTAVVNTGGRYDPATDTWVATTMTGAPTARGNVVLPAVWTGNRMIVWGGYSGSTDLNTGGLYDPALDRWTNTTTSGAPAGRYDHQLVWVGESMVVFGGNNYSTVFGDTYLYTPPPACQPAPQGLVAWWPGEGNANDLVGTNHGTLRGGATFAPGKVGQAFKLDGTNDYVEIAAAGNFGVSTGLTVQAWIRDDALISSGTRTLASKYDYSRGQVSWFFTLNAGHLRLGVCQDGWATTYREAETVGSVVSTGLLMHVAATFAADSQAIRIYVNGIEAPAALLTAGVVTSVYPSTAPVVIGAFRNYPGDMDGFWAGLVDELSLFPRALTANEIAEICAAGSAGMCSPPAPCSNCPPSIVAHPVSRTFFAGESASFSVTATGTAPLACEWRKDGVPIGGATNASFTIANAQTNDAGNYSVQVSNPYGTAISSNAILTVVGIPSPFQEVLSFSLQDYWCENHLSVADVDRDGRQDIILMTTALSDTNGPPWHYTCRALLLHAEADGTFTDSVIANYPGQYGYDAVAADLNNDGAPDLILREGSGTHVLLNNGSGGFQPVWTGRPGYSCTAVSDVNHDGFLDIISGTQSGSGGLIELFTNNGSGTNFMKTWQSRYYGSGYDSIKRVLDVNLNNDGQPDIAAIEIYTGLLITLLGSRSGAPFVEGSVIPMGDRTFALASGRVNGDSLADLAASVGWGRVRVFVNRGDGSMADYWQSPNLTNAPGSLALADFDQDGFDDIFVGTFADGALRVYRNKPGAGFEPWWQGSIPGRGYTGTVADMNGDGYPDLIVGEYKHLRVWINTLGIPRITKLSLDGGTPTIVWTAVPGQSYRVECKTGLGDSEWIPLEGEVTAGALSASKTDTAARPASQRFYRVVKRP